MRLSAGVLAALLVLPVAAVGVQAGSSPAPLADSSACQSIPCGYITPVIIIDLDHDGAIELSPDRSEITIDATVTYRFDIDQEGFGAWEPTNPPRITLRFTRKPAWLEASVDPNSFAVDMSPQHTQADPSTPTQPEASYEYTQDVTITLAKNDRPIVDSDGDPTVRMGLYARSSESGLYKSGYGFREIRVQPTGFPVVTDRSKVEGVFASVPLDGRGADDLRIPFHNVAVDMDLLSEINVWKPTHMVFKIVDTSSGQTALHPDMWATIVDEEGNVVYQTGFRHPHNGILQLKYAFPDVGRYNVLVGGRPTPNLSQSFWQPVTASFPIVIERFGSPTYPATYNATFYESLQAFAGDPGAEQQFEKTIPFPVQPGAGEATLDASLYGRAYVSPQQPPTGPARVAVEVLDPEGEVLASEMLDPQTSDAELGFTPDTPGSYAIRIAGTAVHPVDYGVGATLGLDLSIPYADPPEITRDNVRHVEPGLDEVTNGPVTFSLEGADDPAPWTATEIGAAVDAPGELRELTVTVVEDDGTILYTQDTTEPVDTLDVTYPFPHAGRFLVVVTAEPAPGTGASWQTQSAAFPVTVGDPAAETVTYPATYEASYESTIAQVQGDAGTPTSQYDRFYPFPVFPGAESVDVQVTLANPSGSFEITLRNANGTEIAAAQAGPGQPSVSLSPDRIRPERHIVHVAGTGAVGSTYTVDIGVEYGEEVTRDNPLKAPVQTDAPDNIGGALPGFEAALVALALLGVAWAVRKSR